MSLLLLSPIISAAQGYQPLATGLPGITSVSNGNIGQYLETYFEIGISIAAALAVVMIIVGGIQYLSSDAMSGKEEGKSKITSAIWGLLLALISFLILNTINPQLVTTTLDIKSATSDSTGTGMRDIPGTTVVQTATVNGTVTKVTFADGTTVTTPNSHIVDTTTGQAVNGDVTAITTTNGTSITSSDAADSTFGPPSTLGPIIIENNNTLDGSGVLITPTNPNETNVFGNLLNPPPSTVPPFTTPSTGVPNLLQPF